MTSLIIVAIILPFLLGCAFLLGRYLRARSGDGVELTAVTRQHLELYRGGQLPEAAVEAVKRRYHEWLDQGDVERIESSLRPGTQYIVKVRALAEIGSEEACQILERQIERRLSDNHMDQAWYWIDLANSLRNLNREESLPLLLDCVNKTDEFPLIHYFAAETVCFLGFGGYAIQHDTEEGRSALRLLHRAFEGLRFGVPPQVVVEARLGEVLENLWDQRPGEPDPLLVRLFVEVRRHIRRASHMESAFSEEPFEQEAYELQLSRMAALEPALEDYLQDSGPALLKEVKSAKGIHQQDVLAALYDLRYDTGSTLIPLLDAGRLEHAEVAVMTLRWSKDPSVGPFLRTWVMRSMSLARRGMRRLRPWPPHKSSVPESLPYHAILYALRGQPTPESEQFLLGGAHDWDPTYRCAAISSLGWWEPFSRAEALLHLQDARFDPSAEVRHSARAALARLGERQALQWFRQALNSENRQRALEATQAIAVESLTLLWPDLDVLADCEDADLAYCAREALEQLQEELDHRMGR